MDGNPQIVNAVPANPDGADMVILRVSEAVCHWGEAFLYSMFRVSPDLWNGPNGLRGVVEQAIKENNVPNQRFFEVVNPRTVAERAGLIGSRRHKRRLR